MGRDILSFQSSKKTKQQKPHTSSSSSDMSDSKSSPTYRLYLQGALAAMAGAAASHPLDVTKTRMQLQGESIALPAGSVSAIEVQPKKGFVGMMVHIYQTNGITKGLYSGLSASLARQLVYSGVRFGVYDEIKNYLSNGKSSGDLPFFQRLFAGLSAGAIGSFAGNPADVAMIRMQSDGKLPESQRRNYKNIFDGLTRIVKEEGIVTLWKGSAPTIARAMVVTAAQFVSYDVIKESLIRTFSLQDNRPTQLLSSIGAGVVASLSSAPLDMIRVRYMSAQPGTYSSPLHVAASTVKNEGILALYKGFAPTLLRQGPYVVVMFLTLEEIKRFWKWLDRKN